MCKHLHLDGGCSPRGYGLYAYHAWLVIPYDKPGRPPLIPFWEYYVCGALQEAAYRLRHR